MLNFGNKAPKFGRRCRIAEKKDYIDVERTG
jgi:hypothetical protein